MRPQYSKALVYSGEHGKLDLVELRVPELKPDEALVRVTACTLCGSDLHSLHGRRKVPTPTVLGHEIVGELVEMGNQFPTMDMENKPLRLGDHVTWAIVANCGNCFYCRRGLEQKCENACKYGHMGFGSGYELSGGLAEYCVLASGTKTIKLPEGVALEVITPASCATATVMAAMSGLPEANLSHSSIAIIGAGMLGLTACAVAKQRGWSEIVVIDPVLSKRETALRFGATRVYPPQEWPLHCEFRPSHGYDAVIELSGAQPMFMPALEALRIGGHLVLVGAVAPVPPISILPEYLVRHQITLRGIHNYRPTHLLEAVHFLSKFGNAFPFAEQVSMWHDLTETIYAANTESTTRPARIGVKPSAQP